ncbi:acetylornithine deacetylase [Candidatus Vecturithrix granuli]|uniref:Acetylornithine deacetylase n=1 Tax=Vecturithrix granuli TaxID=1499967 RepID=A0A081BYE0_VECG1|nr:acetylornithine deacetylase [Candidatus Vecturithrix granuli]
MNDYIATRYAQFLQDLETVVNIDSASDHLPGLAQVAAFFERRFSTLGWYVKTHRFLEGFGPCLQSSNVNPESFQGQYDVLCLGHIDTVFPEGTAQERPFRLVNGRAMGPGVADMKAGLTAALHVAETLEKFGISKKLSVCMAFNSDEEIGSPASRPWIETLAQRSKRVFVLEPCRATGDYVLQRKGVGFYQILCRGKAAHAGVEPEKGINAVVELAHQILKINSFGNPEKGTTVNVDVASGGTKTNVIPEYASAFIDIRVTDPEEIHRIETLFAELPQQASMPGVRVEVSGGVNRPPMVPSPATLKLWDHIAKIGAELGLAMNWIASGGGSDGNFTAALGVPTIDALGPQGGRAHSEDEYLELHHITPTVQLLCNVCAALADGVIE